MSTTRYCQANFGPTKTGLTPGYQLYTTAGVASGSRITAGIVEIGHGVYCANVDITNCLSGSILWDSGETLPKYAAEDYRPIGTSTFNASTDEVTANVTKIDSATVKTDANGALLPPSFTRLTIQPNSTQTTINVKSDDVDIAENALAGTLVYADDSRVSGFVLSNTALNSSGGVVTLGGKGLLDSLSDGDTYLIVTLFALSGVAFDASITGAMPATPTANSLQAVVKSNLDAKVSAVGTGGGSVAVPILCEIGGTPVDGMAARISTDLAGTNMIAGPLYSNAFGIVTFYLDPPDPYYLWRQLAHTNLVNPSTLIWNSQTSAYVLDS
jgi:hypothetical protein